MKKVTIKEIASEMGLSRNTVAKALSGSEVVAYNTRLSVIEKASEMGYQKMPKNAVRLLNQWNNTESRTVIVLAHTEISVFWNEIILGVSEELKNNGYKLKFNFVNEEDELDLSLSADWEQDAIGVILLSVFSERFIERITQKVHPIIFLDSPVDTNQFTKYGDVVFCEGKDCVRKIVDSLIAQGRKKIAFLGDVTYCRSVRERYEGYVTAMEAAGIPFDENFLITKHKKDRYYKDYEVREAIESLPYLPEAFVCANDDVAIDVIRILKSKNIRVPEDIAVTGYDNLESLTHVDPILTTVNVKNQLLGRRLVQQLLFRIKFPDFTNEVIQMGVEVIFRRSSGSAKK